MTQAESKTQAGPCKHHPMSAFRCYACLIEAGEVPAEAPAMECHNPGCHRATQKRDGYTRSGKPRWVTIPGTVRPLPLTPQQAKSHRAAGHDVRPVRQEVKP